MNIRSLFNPLRRAPVLALFALGSALGAVACGSTGGTGGSGGGAGGTGGAAAQLPSPKVFSVTASRTANDGGVEPGTLTIALGNRSVGCVVSHADFPCLEPGQWVASIAIPPALQKPGSYPLSSPALVTDSAESGSEGNDCCFCGGGSFAIGALEIVSIDASKVVLRLSGTTTTIGSTKVDADGEHTADICLHSSG